MTPEAEDGAGILLQIPDEFFREANRPIFLSGIDMHGCMLFLMTDDIRAEVESISCWCRRKRGQH